MEITMRPMTAEEAWDFIISTHINFHGTLKYFGYTTGAFIPDSDDIREMFNNENLTNSDLQKYHDIFVNQIYDEKKLRKFDNVFAIDVKPHLERMIDKFLLPLIPSWNAVLPKRLEILCTYGFGSGYWRKSDDIAVVRFRISESLDNKYGIFNTLFHEFVHLLIEKPIIQKYDVPQDLKERIVDLICCEFTDIPSQKAFENSFANKYITPEAIKTNLPVAVQNMMADYNVSRCVDSGKHL